MSYDGIVQCAVVRVFTELRLHHKVDSFSFDPQNYTQNTTERQRGKVFETFNISDIFHKYPQPMSCCVPAVNIIIIIITLCNAY